MQDLLYMGYSGGKMPYALTPNHSEPGLGHYKFSENKGVTAYERFECKISWYWKIYF